MATPHTNTTTRAPSVVRSRCWLREEKRVSAAQNVLDSYSRVSLGTSAASSSTTSPALLLLFLAEETMSNATKTLF